MKIILTLTALGLLLTACSTTTSDASIQRQLVGVWTSDSHPGQVIEERSDGITVLRINGKETDKGRWLVSNGYEVIGPLGDWSRVNSALLESNKVLSISGDKAVFLTPDGRTETYHKQR